MSGIVTEDILPLETGEVKVDGKRWSAYSDYEIKKDSLITVKEINGVKLKVEKKED
jgi:membrane protein implicated in regulation of membrane protease activity